MMASRRLDLPAPVGPAMAKSSSPERSSGSWRSLKQVNASTVSLSGLTNLGPLYPVSFRSASPSSLSKVSSNSRSVGELRRCRQYAS